MLQSLSTTHPVGPLFLRKFWTLLVLFLAGFIYANAACDLPTNLAVNNITGSTATLSWTANGNFYSIRHRIKNPQGAWINSSSTPSVKLIVNLLPNTTYEYQIQSHCTGSPSTSGYTPLAEFTTGAACGTPTGVYATNIKSTSAYLIWTGPSNASFYHTRIRLASPQGPWINTTNTGNIKIYSNLLPNTTYEFQVATQCVNDPAVSVYSPIVQFTTCNALITDFSLTSSANSLSVNGVSCATELLGDSAQSMYVEGCKNIAAIGDTSLGNALGMTTICSSVTGYVDSTTNPVYRFGQRSYSITPTSNGQAVVILFFTQNDFTKYNQDPSTNNFLKLPTSGNQSDPAVTNFRIAHQTGSTITLLSPALQWDATFNIWYAIVQRNSIEGSYYFTTTGTCAGNANFNLAVTNTTGHSTTATWTPANTVPPGWYRFRIREINSNTWTLLGTSNFNTSSKLIQGLSPLTTYEIQMIKFCSSTVTSPWSPGVIFTTPNTCYIPTGQNVTNITGTSAKVNWTSVPGALYYIIRHKQTTASAWTSGSVTVPTKTLLGLVPSKTYEYQVATHCSGSTVTGPFSASSFFTTAALKDGREDPKEEIPASSITIYPNPTQGNVHVVMASDRQEEYTIKLSDLTGRVVMEQHVDAIEGFNEFEMNMAHLTPGMYIAQFFNSTELVQVSRIEKQ